MGAVAGPAVVEPLGALATSLGIPALAGPFLLAAVAYLCAGTTFMVLLRPDPYLLACERLGVDPAATVAVEDSVTGATSAVAAGCRVLYVPSTEGQPDVDGARTHPGLVGVDVATLAALTSGVPVGGPVGQSGA